MEFTGSVTTAGSQGIGDGFEKHFGLSMGRVLGKFRNALERSTVCGALHNPLIQAAGSKSSPELLARGLFPESAYSPSLLLVSPEGMGHRRPNLCKTVRRAWAGTRTFEPYSGSRT